MNTHMKAHFGEREINSILSKARIFNRQIGTLEVFTVNPFSCYIIELDNGVIYFTPADFQLDAEGSFTPELLEEISSRFQVNLNMSMLPFNAQSYRQRSRRVAGIVFSLIACSVLVLLFSWPEDIDPGQVPEPFRYTTVSIPEAKEAFRKKMAVREAANPLNFLISGGNWNAVSASKVIVEGKINSVATAVVFKNPTIRLTLHSKTGALIAKEKFTVPGLLRPDGQISFSHAVEDFYGKVENVVWEVLEVKIDK